MIRYMVAQNRLVWHPLDLFAHAHVLGFKSFHADVSTSTVTTGDKTERRRNQRADKAASVAALLQHAISDDRFAAAVQDLEASFGTQFSGFITGRQCCALLHGCAPTVQENTTCSILRSTMS